MDDIPHMKKYIFEEVSSLYDHQKIIHLLDIYNVKYTNNNNGIYYNLSTGDDEIIKRIYILLSNEKKNISLTNEKDMKLIDLKLSINKTKTPYKKEQLTISKTPLTMNMFSKDNQVIINYSKQYKL
jgi:hypothetical protein